LDRERRKKTSLLGHYEKCKLSNNKIVKKREENPFTNDHKRDEKEMKSFLFLLLDDDEIKRHNETFFFF
jgi:hypothetical protein